MSVNIKNQDGSLTMITGISSNTWSGTMAQYEADDAAGLIPDGTIVDIIDDETPETLQDEIDEISSKVAKNTTDIGTLSSKLNVTASTNANNCVTSERGFSTWILDESATNIPISGQRCVIETLYNGWYAKQIASLIGYQRMFSRSSWDNCATWADWEEYTPTSNLDNYFTGRDSLQNCNEAIKNGAYLVTANNGTVSNTPNNEQHGMLTVTTRKDNYFIMQLWVSYSTSNTYVRNRWGGTWTAWKKLPNGTLAIADGGTGATTAANARTNLGLGSAATASSGGTVTNGNTALVNGGTVYTAVDAKQNKTWTKINTTNVSANTQLTVSIDVSSYNEIIMTVYDNDSASYYVGSCYIPVLYLNENTGKQKYFRIALGGYTEAFKFGTGGNSKKIEMLENKFPNTATFILYGR